MSVNKSVNKPITKEQLQKKYNQLCDKYDELVTVHNYNATVLQHTIKFMELQCGILYTAITGLMTKEPLQKIPSIHKEPYDQDLIYFRDGMVTYTKTLATTGDLEKAQRAFEKHLYPEGKASV